jgi:hypothetical protein
MKFLLMRTAAFVADSLLLAQAVVMNKELTAQFVAPSIQNNS